MGTKHTPGPWIHNGPYHIQAETLFSETRANGELDTEGDLGNDLADALFRAKMVIARVRA